jgi:hypothetical protein
MSSLDDIMIIESGDASQEEYVAAFQRLYNSRLVFQLQGWYQRELLRLVEAGLIH